MTNNQTPKRLRLRALLRPAPLLAGAILIVALVAAILAQKLTAIDLFSEEGVAYISEKIGAIGVVVYVFVLALTIVVSQLPGVPLAVGAGALWGVLPGFGLTLAGSLLGSISAYFIGRHLGRSAMFALTGRYVRFNPNVSPKIITIAILLSRLIPVMPFDIISYAAGVSSVDLKGYVLATTLGIIPSVLVLSFLGDRMLISPVSSLILSAAAVIVLVLIPVFMRRASGTRIRELFVWDHPDEGSV
jgi:uncharacterized membrane protein YdjX (TVP38/TMEM64 family)